MNKVLLGIVVGVLAGVAIGAAVFLPDDADDRDLANEGNERAIRLEAELEAARDALEAQRAAGRKLNADLADLEARLADAERREGEAVAARDAALDAARAATEAGPPGMTEAERAAAVEAATRKLEGFRTKGIAALLDTAGMAKLAEELLALGEPGLAMVRELLKSEKAQDRVLAAQVLGAMGTAEAMSELAHLAVNDGDQGAANSAARALMLADAPGVVDALRTAYEQSPYEAVRVNSLFGLARNGDPKGAADYLAYMQDEEKPEYMRNALMQSLFLIDDPIVTSAMNHVVKEARAEGAESASAVLVEAARWYGRVKGPAAKQALEALLLDGDPAVQAAAQQALQGF